MLKIDYRLNPGRELNRENFEIDLKQKPLISIVTPYYNSQKYIEEIENNNIDNKNVKSMLMKR